MIERYQVSSQLPEKYKDFNKFRVERKPDLDYLRTHNSFIDAVDGLWTRLAMMVDDSHQQNICADLTARLRQLPVGMHRQSIETYWHDLENSSIFPFIAGLKSEPVVNISVNDPKFREKVFGRHKYGRKDRNFWVTAAFNQKLKEAEASDQIFDYVNLLRMLNCARENTLDPVNFAILGFDNPRSQLRSKTVRPDAEGVLRDLWRKSSPYLALSQELYDKVKVEEDKLFGENAWIAHVLWSTLVFPRTANLSPSKKQRFSEELKTALSSLVKNDYQSVVKKIESMMADYQEVFPDFVKEILQINPGILAEQRQEFNSQINNVNKQEDEARRLAEEARLKMVKEKIEGWRGITLGNSEGTIRIVGVSNKRFVDSYVLEVTGKFVVRSADGVKRAWYRRKMNADKLMKLIKEEGLTPQS